MRVLACVSWGAGPPTPFGKMPPADTSRPVALVIGNGSYPQSPVDSVPGDARAFADVLRDGGFHVVFAENAKRTEIEAAISAITRKLRWAVTPVVSSARPPGHLPVHTFCLPTAFIGSARA